MYTIYLYIYTPPPPPPFLKTVFFSPVFEQLVLTSLPSDLFFFDNQTPPPPQSDDFTDGLIDHTDLDRQYWGS